ncbi:MAG: tetratricopeptide repeat protein [Sphingobium sp.]|nr:tetratricopeptide repeat protein [Sphingobium sp.]
MLRLLIPGALASVALLSGCQTPAEQAATYMQQAQALSEAGDQRAALKAMQKAIAARDDNAEYFLTLSTIQMRAGNPGQAFVAARQALDLDSANRTALTLVANIGLQVGQVDEATDAAERLLSLDPSSLVGLQVKGLAALYKNKDAEAETNAQRLLQLSPTDEAGTIIRARVLAKAQKFEEAIALIDHAMQQGRTTPAFIITKINLNRALRRPEEMAKAFEQLRSQVEDPPAKLRLDEINLLYKLGRKDAARAATDRYLTSGAGDATDLAALQRIWSEFDRVPFTRESLQRSAPKWKDPASLLGVGRYLLSQNQPQLADDLYFSFREGVRPIGISLHQRALAGLNHVADARAGAEVVLKRDPDDADSLMLRAMFAMQDRNPGLAIEGLQKAIEADPGNPEPYVALAEVHARSGDRWRAGQVFEDGLKQLPQNFLLIERYTRFLHDSGNKSRAVSVSRAFARAVPSSVYAWTIMAQQCAWAGDAACATEAASGRQQAATMYQLDDLPGTPKDRGLLGKF